MSNQPYMEMEHQTPAVVIVQQSVGGGTIICGKCGNHMNPLERRRVTCCCGLICGLFFNIFGICILFHFILLGMAFCCCRTPHQVCPNCQNSLDGNSYCCF